MTDIVKPPIIRVEGLDIQAYTSIEDLERQVEPIDIPPDEYTAYYDSEGRLLHLGVEYVQKQHREKKKGLRGLIEQMIETLSLTPPKHKAVIKSIETEPRHKEELRKALIESLASGGLSQEFLSKASLEELINKLIETRGIVKF